MIQDDRVGDFGFRREKLGKLSRKMNMYTFLSLLALVAIWLILQKWLLPRFGVPT
jgi:hypothetical protein